MRKTNYPVDIDLNVVGILGMATEPDEFCQGGPDASLADVAMDFGIEDLDLEPVQVPRIQQKSGKPNMNLWDTLNKSPETRDGLIQNIRGVMQTMWDLAKQDGEDLKGRKLKNLWDGLINTERTGLKARYNVDLTVDEFDIVDVKCLTKAEL